MRILLNFSTPPLRKLEDETAMVGIKKLSGSVRKAS
jgi:hypothetical protein